MKTKIFSASLIWIMLLCSFDSYAGWELLQNSPTTNDLHSVWFLDDNTGWIAGYNNTIFKTTNSGGNWVQQTSPVSSNFECITFVSADTGWACGSGGTVIKTTNGGSSWFSQTFTAVRFNSMDFIDASTGFICGDNGIIRKTTNGGANWNPQVSGIGQTLHQIKFLNATTGFAAGDNAYILKTSTGGNTWEIKSGPGIASQIFYTIGISDNYNTAAGTLTKYSGITGEYWFVGDFPAEPIYSMTRIDEEVDTYLGVGGNGYTIKTTNAGINWTQQQSPTSQNLYSVHYTGDNIIWAVGTNGNILKNIPDWVIINRNISAKAADFIDQNTGWVVGISGYIAKTTNSGKNWISQTSGTTSLNSVYFTDANTGHAVGFLGTILKTTNGGTNWSTQSSGTTHELHSVYFINANTGYSAGNFGSILKTTNSGTNWSIQTSGISDNLYSVYFINANTGYSAGNFGKILKTTNGGTNWLTQTSGIMTLLSSVYFINANTGYSVGNFGKILKTTNGGTNWDMQPSITSLNLFSVHFVDANVGYTCSVNQIYQTNNGGNTWFEVEQTFGLIAVYDIEMVVENNTAVGFAAGNQILRTSFDYYGGELQGNSGNYPGWVQVNSGTNGFISGVEYINPFVAFGVGGDPGGSEQGLVLRTINGGQTWTRQQSNLVTSSLSDVSFADVNNGIAVGSLGKIIHTTNGGANWIQQTSGTSNPIESVDMLDLNNAFACGSFGLMLYTSNGGINWQTQTNGTLGAFWNDVDYINPTTATAVGMLGKIIRTTNTGLNWLAQTGAGSLNLTGIEFTDVNNGIAISNEGPVLRTTNGGTNWIQTDSISGYASGVSFIDPYNAFIVTQFGGVSRIYRSTNGGYNWLLQNSITASLSSVSFADANNGLITGTDGLILRTSSAGVVSGNNSAYSRNGLNLPINDFQNTKDSINVSITDNLSVPIVTRVYLKVDTVLHTNDGDLEFYLEHNGITDTLVYQNGSSGDNFLGTFLNDATNFPLVSGSSPFRGSFKPHRPLSKFNGQNPNGYWKLRIYDRAAGNTGTLQAWSLTITYAQVIGVTGNHNVPNQFHLYQNYPNPFNPVTKIKFSIPQGTGKEQSVNLKIYDILGREVAVLINQEMRPGSYLVEWNATNFASGIYFYRLEAGQFAETKKMVLVK